MPASQADHQKAKELILKSMSQNLEQEMDRLVDDSYVAALPFPTRESDTLCPIYDWFTVSETSEGPGREGLKQIFVAAREAFPDAVWTEVFSMVDGNRQVLRYRAKGTHKKDWLGITAKNNVIDLPAIFVIDLNDDGKIISTEMFMDGMALTKQMSS